MTAPNNVTDMSRVFPALNWTGDGITAADAIYAPLAQVLRPGAGNRVALYCQYSLRTLTPAPTEIVHIEVMLIGTGAPGANTPDPLCPDRTTPPLSQFTLGGWAHCDIRPTQNPRGYPQTRHEVCWETFLLPDLRVTAEVNPIYGAAGAPAFVYPVVVVTSPTSFARVGLRFSSYGGPAVPSVGRVDEWVNIFASVGGMSQGF